MSAPHGFAGSSVTLMSNGAGLKWHYLPTERLWFNAELFHISKAPYSGAFTPYTAGMTGWVPIAAGGHCFLTIIDF